MQKSATENLFFSPEKNMTFSQQVHNSQRDQEFQEQQKYDSSIVKSLIFLCLWKYKYLYSMSVTHMSQKRAGADLFVLVIGTGHCVVCSGRTNTGHTIIQ